MHSRLSFEFELGKLQIQTTIEKRQRMTTTTNYSKKNKYMLQKQKEKKQKDFIRRLVYMLNPCITWHTCIYRFLQNLTEILKK